MPRAGLTPEVVVDEAARVCDDSGFERLTLAAVAQRFGVAVPSLYKHVAGLDALRREVALRGTRELGRALAAAAARGEGLADLAHAYRDYARSHPGRYEASLREPDPDDAEAGALRQAALEAVLAVLSGYGLSGDDAIDATRTLRAALHGFVQLEVVGGFGLPQDVDRSFDRLVEILDAALRNWNP
jgi:AcrR family transcriptional regulator